MKAKPDPPCRSGSACEYALPPTLSDQNEDAWELWLAVKTQWRGGGMGLIGLDYNVVYKEAARLEIELTPCIMKKIQALEKHVLEVQSSKLEAERKKL